MVRVTCEFIALKTPEAPVSGVFAFGRRIHRSPFPRVSPPATCRFIAEFSGLPIEESPQLGCDFRVYAGAGVFEQTLAPPIPQGSELQWDGRS
jgi:hypothetical protein